MHERRLAGSRRPHDGDELAAGQVERHAAQRVHDVIADVVVLRQIANVITGTLGRSEVIGRYRNPSGRHYWSLAVVVIGFAGAGGSLPANA